MPSKVSAHLHYGKWHDIEVEDDVTAYLEFPNGSTGVFIASTGDLPGTNRLEITCDQAEFLRTRLTPATLPAQAQRYPFPMMRERGDPMAFRWKDGYLFAATDDEEQTHRNNLNALKAEQGIRDDEFYHYDTPLTVQHETEALLEAGFASVQVLKSWGATYTIKAVK